MPFLGVIRDHLLSAIAQEGEDTDWAAIDGRCSATQVREITTLALSPPIG